MDRDFERRYSVEFPKLSLGENVERFEIDSSFFKEFKDSPVENGNVDVVATFEKFQRHLMAEFHFAGQLTLACDRCLEHYPHDVDFTQQVVYSFDPELEFDTDEVVLVEEDNPRILLSGDFFDFISLQVPLRRVPDEAIHECPESVLKMLGLSDPEEQEVPESDDEDIDPRWAALKKLKGKD